MNLARQRALIGFSQVGRTLSELSDAKGGGPLLVREAGLRFLMLVFQGRNPGRTLLILRGVGLRLSDWKRSHQSRRASAGAGAAAAPESVNSMAAVPSRQPRPCCVHSVLESRKEITLFFARSREQHRDGGAFTFTAFQLQLGPVQQGDVFYNGKP